MNRHLSVLALGLWLAAAQGGEGGYTVTTIDGMAYGPGPMPATPITDGVFTHVTVGPDLSGQVAFFNNGVAEPNIPGEEEIFGQFRGGLLSNGVPFNEHLHGGIINIGQGALRMLAVVASGGPAGGGETYRVDERLNWRLKTDLALDPGYPQGLVITRGLDITTGVLWLPPSRQSEAGVAGGVDQADRIPVGGPLVGYLGDRDDDGFLEGEIIGVSRVPLEFLFVPGAPLAMTRTIRTDIPLTPRVSGLLELAGVANLTLILDPPQGWPVPDSPLGRYYHQSLPSWAEDFAGRAQRAADRLEAIQAPEAPLARELATVLIQAQEADSDPARYREQVAEALGRLEAALPDLEAAFRAVTASES